jgi:hypothetical protein
MNSRAQIVMPDINKSFLKKFLFIYLHVHTLFGTFLPTAPSLSPSTPSLPGRNYSALFSNFVEEKT